MRLGFTCFDLNREKTLLLSQKWFLVRFSNVGIAKRFPLVLIQLASIYRRRNVASYLIHFLDPSTKRNAVISQLNYFTDFLKFQGCFYLRFSFRSASRIDYQMKLHNSKSWIADPAGIHSSIMIMYPSNS